MKRIGIAINPTKDKNDEILNMVKKKFEMNFDLDEIRIFNSFKLKDEEFKIIPSGPQKIIYKNGEFFL